MSFSLLVSLRPSGFDYAVILPFYVTWILVAKSNGIPLPPTKALLKEKKGNGFWLSQ